MLCLRPSIIGCYTGWLLTYTHFHCIWYAGRQSKHAKDVVFQKCNMRNYTHKHKESKVTISRLPAARRGGILGYQVYGIKRVRSIKASRYQVYDWVVFYTNPPKLYPLLFDPFFYDTFCNELVITSVTRSAKTLPQPLINLKYTVLLYTILLQVYSDFPPPPRVFICSYNCITVCK